MKFALYAVIALCVAVAVALFTIPDLLRDLLWMQELGYAFVFWRMLFIRAGLFIGPALVVFAVIWLNCMIAIRASFAFNHPHEIVLADQNTVTLRLTRTRAALAAGILAAIPALLFGRVFMSFQEHAIRFIWGGTFGSADPLYARDIGFYVFCLPLYELVQNATAVLFFVACLMSAGIYLARVMTTQGATAPVSSSVTGSRHLYILLCLLVLCWGWGFYLERYALLYASGGAVFGAGYTEDTVVRLGLLSMVGASILCALCLVYAAVRRSVRPAAVGVTVYALAAGLALVVLPAVIQKFIVQPNELELETPYLEYNIRFTRAAYRLDSIEARDYPGDAARLTRADIDNNQATLKNIRLWDWRPLIQTFRQLQEIRLYYSFYEVDVDRYHLTETDYRQVMLSARELAAQLPDKAATWVNRHLQFTHGYGAVMSHVSRSAGEGLPRFILKDLPPRTSAPGVTVDRPALYYGEHMPGFRIVSTGVKEFDFPRGDENVYTAYAGSGGVLIDSLWRRLLYAWCFSDINILLTRYIGQGSRIQYTRPLQERIRAIAPFLQLDNDPYLVVSDGRFYWVQDAYTVSSHYPYSEPAGSVNYIRNSVKIVVDAYEGSVTLYAVEPDEPLLRAYSRAFPGLFVPAATMRDDLRAHIRYPQDLFSIQAEMYRTYHMTVPQVFYNREDLWTRANEKYAGATIPVEPYYILIELPGEDRLQYLIMTPFTPENRDNMIAWLAAKCDQPGYGQLLLYKLPKERLIYGPLQIEAMIDQDDRISQKLSLWDQRGSKVIRGNLLVIPLERSFLYVEPVYLIAEESDIPQLKRVIGVYGKKVVMQKTIEKVLAVLAGGSDEQPPAADVAGPAPGDARLQHVREQLDQAERALQNGDWSAFGNAMDALRKKLGTTRP